MNLYDGIPDPMDEEKIDILYQRPNGRIERIVSRGQTTPEEEWYDQEEEEWVALLEGEAELILEKAETGYDTVHLKRGDTLFIEAHRRHRVIYTSQDPPCVWLCVFLDPSSAAQNKDE